MSLKIVDVTKTYKKRISALKWVNVPALDKVSYEFLSGNIYGIIGMSGSGKSTLAKILVKFDRPDSGSIFYDGRDVSRLGNEQMRKYSIYIRNVFQDPYSSLNPLQSVEWHIQNTAAYNYLGISDGDLERISIEFGIPLHEFGKRYVETLSGGERQRLAFAIAMIANPDVIVLDEPFSMIDSINSMYLLNKLKSEAKKKTVIYIDQNVGRVLYIASRIIVLDAGKIVEEGKTSDIIERPESGCARSLLWSYREMAGSSGLV